MNELNDRELLLLAYLEGDLDAAGKQRAEALMAEDAALMHEYRQLTGVRLEPETVTYAGKDKLKRTTRVKKSPLRWVIPATAVAACLALLVLLYSPGAEQTGSSVTGFATPGVDEITKGNSTKEVTASVNKEEIIIPSKTGKQENYVHTPLKKQEVRELEIVTKTITQPEMLALKTAEINVEQPDLYTPTGPVYTEPIVLPEPKKKGINEWYANAGDKISGLLGYLQKPKININRTDENGQQRLVISLKTDKYDVEREVGLNIR